MLNVLKFLHCSDLHLDMPFTSLGSSSDRSSIRRQDLKDVLERIVSMAKHENVDMLFISGDLYENNYVRKSTVHYINDKFKEIPHIRVFIAPGNHDPYILGSYYRSFKWSSNVCILNEDNPCVYIEELKTCIHGAAFKDFYQEESLIHGFKPVDRSLINILLVHGTVDMEFGNGDAKKRGYNPMQSSQLNGLGMDYIALGHFHNRMDEAGDIKSVYNPGSPEPLGFDEEGEHGVYVGTISFKKDNEKQLDIRFEKTGRRFYKSFGVDIQGCNTDEQVVERISSCLGRDEAYNGLYSIHLKGYTEQGFKADPARIQSYLKDKLFFIRIKDETAVEYNLEEIIRGGGLRGLFTRKIHTRMCETEDEHEKKRLIKALYYGLEALSQGDVGV